MGTVTPKQQGLLHEVVRGRVRLPDSEEMGDLVGLWQVEGDPDDWQDRVPSGGAKVELVGNVGEVDEVHVLMPVLEGWGLRVSFTAENGQVGTSDIHLRPVSTEATTPGSRALRKLGFGAVVKEAEALFRDTIVSGRYLGPAWPDPPKRPGRAGHDPRAFALWAQRYVEALEVDRRSPIKVMVARLQDEGKTATTESEVRSKVNKARVKGMLTAAPPGQAGGELTGRAKTLLAEIEGQD